MGGLSRYDLFRILLPGAIVLFLTDAALRIIRATPDYDSEALADLQHALEDPLVGIAVAFGIGLWLYFIDPGYSTAAFFDNMPSTYLHQKLKKNGIQTNALSLFFYASDALMPGELRERALLFGSFFRIGFLATVLTLATGTALPPILLTQPEVEPHAINWSRPDIWVATVLIALVAAVPILMLNFDKKARQLKRGPLAALLLLCLFSCLLWINQIIEFLPAQAESPRWQIAASTLVMVVWGLMRIFGPLKDRWAYWTSQDRRKSRARPDEPYPPLTNALLDAAVVTTAGIGLFISGSELAPGQVLGIAGLLMAGMTLSITRKHERQLQGIYGNQNYWIDSAFDEIVKLKP